MFSSKSSMDDLNYSLNLGKPRPEKGVGVKFRCGRVLRRCDGCPEFESDPHFFASGVKISPSPSLGKRGISQNSGLNRVKFAINNIAAEAINTSASVIFIGVN
jgi:hypothetical protein